MITLSDNAKFFLYVVTSLVVIIFATFGGLSLLQERYENHMHANGYVLIERHWEYRGKP